MKSRRFLLLLHIIGWSVFVTLPVMILPRPRIVPEDIPTSFFLLFLVVSTIPLMGLFYGNLFFALPKIYLRKHYVWYALVLILSLVLAQLVTRSLYELFPWVQDAFGHSPQFLVRGTAYRTGVVLLVSFGLFVYQRWRMAESAKAQAELAYLKAQINPHFLFNTLNSIYYLTLQQSERAPMAVEKLSAIMRYVIDEGNHDWVPLEREVSYLSDYIELQKLRFADNVHVDLSVLGDLSGWRIAPLLLVSFVENAFKHGISMEQSSPIGVRMTVGSHELRFEVHNHKFRQASIGKTESGIGLENTRKRLEIAYPQRHKLEIAETEQAYRVTLILERI